MRATSVLPANQYAVGPFLPQFQLWESKPRHYPQPQYQSFRNEPGTQLFLMLALLCLVEKQEDLLFVLPIFLPNQGPKHAPRPQKHKFRPFFELHELYAKLKLSSLKTRDQI